MSETASRTDISISIIQGDFANHSETWERSWTNILDERGVDYARIDWRDRDAIGNLSKSDVVLWMFSHYSPAERAHARDILFALEQAGASAFPGFADSWHFDDKVAQSYLFAALNIATPNNDILYSKRAVDQWIAQVGEFPVVAKLRGGSGSHNVTLIEDRSALMRYARKAFGRGFSPRPSPTLKIASNVRSARSIGQLIARAKRTPDFLFTLLQTRDLERERGYVYLQRFIPGAKYDLKIAVVNGKLGFIVRDVRKGEFRASGGGSLRYDKSLVTPEVIDLAYRLYDRMGALCTGMDIVVDPSGKPLVIETSFGFSSKAMLAGGGYFDRNGRWIDEPLDAPREILDVLIARARREKALQMRKPDQDCQTDFGTHA